MAKIKSKKPLYIGIVVALAVYVAVMSVWLGVLSAEKKELEEEYKNSDEALTLIVEENQALEALIGEENETSLMVENAHANDYIVPDERVYILE